MAISIIMCSSNGDYENDYIYCVYIYNSDDTLLSDYVYLLKMKEPLL